jgi:hypothetical protein
MCMHIYIKCTKGGWDEIFMYPPPIPKLRKMWHGRSRNQGAIGEHDEHYRMPVGTWVSSGLRQNRWYPPLQLSQSSIWLTLFIL